MSKKYNIGYDISDDLICSLDGKIEEDFQSVGNKSNKSSESNIDELVFDIHEIIKKYQEETCVPIFDEKDFGYFFIQEYLKSLGIQ